MPITASTRNDARPRTRLSAYTRLDPEDYRALEEFRLSIKPVPPTPSALLRHLVRIGLKAVRENADTQVA